MNFVSIHTVSVISLKIIMKEKMCILIQQYREKLVQRRCQWKFIGNRKGLIIGLTEGCFEKDSNANQHWSRLQFHIEKKNSCTHFLHVPRSFVWPFFKKSRNFFSPLKFRWDPTRLVIGERNFLRSSTELPRKPKKIDVFFVFWTSRHHSLSNWLNHFRISKK